MLEFRQEAFFQPYIEHNTVLQREAERGYKIKKKKKNAKLKNYIRKSNEQDLYKTCDH